MFADLRAVSRPRHGDQDAGPSSPESLQSPQEHLHAWLRSLDADTEALPPRFIAALQRALANYGIDSLERTPALEEAGYRLFLSQQRAEIARTAIVAILDRRLEDADELAGHVGAEFREVLDRLAVALEGRDPVVADLAREVRFRYFDEPVIVEARERVYAEIERHVAALTGEPERPDASELIQEIVDCPRPLAPQLTVAMGAASPAARRLLVEAMARRYYRTRSLTGFEPGQLDGYDVALARYVVDGVARQLVSAYIELDDVSGDRERFCPSCREAACRRARGAGPVRTASRQRAVARGDCGSVARRAHGGSDAAGGSPDRRRGCRTAPGPRDVRDRPVHISAGAGRSWSRTRCCAAYTR